MSHPTSPNWFDQTPDSAYLRERQLIGDKSDPSYPKLLPVSRATLWRMVKESRFPAPHKLGPNTTAWRVGDIRKYLADVSNREFSNENA
jgi:prophage regulatory protein